MANHNQSLWQDPGWIRQVHDWIQRETASQSIRITGEIEQPHLYPWSTILHVPTSEGKLFFKATAPETIYEAPLTKMLADWYPGCIPVLVAVDTGRGWMLMRDGGEQLRQSIRPAGNISLWDPVIALYGQVQAGAANHVEELLAAGVPDYRLGRIPSLYRELLADEESLLVGQEKGLTPGEWQQLQEMAHRLEQLCLQLTGYGIPETINHGDFHDGNVLVRDGRFTFIDWADACISHPFMSLRTFFVSIEIALKLEDYAPPTPEMSNLLDHYLGQWQSFGSTEELRSAYLLSRPVASIVKAANWHLTISNIEERTLREKYAWIVPELFREFVVYEKMLPN